MPETTIPEPAEKVAPTRGPWTVNGEGGIVGRVHYGACAIYITAPTTSYLDPAVTAEKALADATLMAAAPDLRDALVQLLRCVSHGGHIYGSSAESQELSIACAKANIALAAAEGRQ